MLIGGNTAIKKTHECMNTELKKHVYVTEPWLQMKGQEVWFSLDLGLVKSS